MSTGAKSVRKTNISAILTWPGVSGGIVQTLCFAVNNDVVLHARDCTAVFGPDKVNPDEHFDFMPGSMPLTKEEANFWLRKSHGRRRCLLCAPDVAMPNWVKVGRRWKLEENAQVS
jgi:hypothetical protein